MYKIFLVEDEKNLNQILTSYLIKEGWTVQSFYDGESALKTLPDHPDLWVLDIMLPDIDGYHLLRQIKEITPNIPCIYISARNSDLDRIMGLEMGSDDYLPKPFSPRELVLRTSKLLDRIYGRSELQTAYRLSSYTVDEKLRIICNSGEKICLTSKEFDLALFFAHHQHQALSREQILNVVWGNEYSGYDRTVDDLVRRLRKKLPDLNIETIYGYGYRVNA